MKNAIPRYNFYKTKYGSELLIDVVDLQYTRKFLTQGKVHILTYYDITFITEGEGEFTIGNRTHLAAPGDVFFSKPGEVRSWDTDRIGNGHALIFEERYQQLPPQPILRIGWGALPGAAFCTILCR